METNSVKDKANKKQKSVEETLWESANKLRGTVESSEYKHVVLGLIFLKFASDKFEERKKELIAEGREKYIDMTEFYTMKNVFYLPEVSRWSYLIENAKQNDIALKIDTALFTVEKNNPALKGALPDNYYSRLNLDVSKLASLLDTINNINTIKDKQQDILGRVYEYFLSKFALAEGKGKGEFYTPKSIVNLIAEMLEPYKGKIYDPACGSGGMFVQSIKFIESHHGNQKDISIYGQENTATTYKLAKMNLAIRGISANLGDIPENTFFKDQHKDLKADYIMANPPFNQKQWRAENELTKDPRWRYLYSLLPCSFKELSMISSVKSLLLKKLTYKVTGSLWIECEDERFLGPGRVELLERIEETGSINKAAKLMGMSYKKAWEMINSLNRQVAKPFVVKQIGGEKGGGSVITAAVKEFIDYHKQLRQRFQDFLKPRLNILSRHKFYCTFLQPNLPF